VIDLHCHLIPGIDDGPADDAAALELARAAADNGIRTIAATPHLRDDYPRVRPRELQTGVRRLNEQLRDAEIEVTVVVGGELDLAWALNASADDLRLASYGQRGSDLLLETPYGALPPKFEELVFDLTVRGYRVLLAHPERNPTFQRDPSRLAALARRGVLIQVTAPALFSDRRRSRSRRLALELIRHGVAHVLATDAHGTGRFRRPELAEGVAALANLAPARARWMVTGAPAAVLAGEPLPSPPNERRQSRRGSVGFRRRRPY
jgi:protein-tyrosine phosphatase